MPPASPPIRPTTPCTSAKPSDSASGKSLVNGPCGGQKNGKCEVNPENDCAWIKIYKRLGEIGQLDKLGHTREDKGYAKFSYPRTISLKGKK